MNSQHRIALLTVTVAAGIMFGFWQQSWAAGSFFYFTLGFFGLLADVVLMVYKEVKG